MIDCKENEDGSFTISWDENDPIESVLNDWTEEDFIEVITNYAEEILACKKFYSKHSSKSGKESGETNISEATEEDYEDFWEGDDITGQEDSDYIQATGEETYGKEFWEEYNSLSKEIDDAKQFLTKNDRLWEG